MKSVALVPGGYKPPTSGHFYLVNEMAKRSEINEVIVLIGHKVRDGITADQSLEIWEIYKNHLSPNVSIRIAEANSPIIDIHKIIGENPQNFYFPVVGMRSEADQNDIKRFDSLGKKYTNFKTIVLSGDPDVSGTKARQALLSGNYEAFKHYLPDVLSDEEKQQVVDILTPQNTLSENVSPGQLKHIEVIIDRLFKRYNVDVAFTKHFQDRVNDSRNGKPITYDELLNLLKKTYTKYGREIGEQDEDFQAVLKDIQHDLNLPFVLTYDTRNNEMDLIAKTIMRKHNFQTSNPILPLEENIDEQRQLLLGYIQSLNEYMISEGMNVQPLPRVELIDNDTKNASDFFGKTAYYNPGTITVTLYTLGRHPKDVMRSYAHEMVHHIQNLEDRLHQINTTNTNEDGKLEEIEREAYERGNITFRKWTDSITNKNVPN
jgi:phosphopantetheine adenylyltransferase